MCIGVKTSLGLEFYGKSVIVTTGTFLRALMHVGQEKAEGGRLGDHVSTGLSADFNKAELNYKDSKQALHLDYWGEVLILIKCKPSMVTKSPPSLPSTTHAAKQEMFHVEQTGRWFHVEQCQPTAHLDQVTCSTTRTTSQTAEIIQDNLHLSPLLQGGYQWNRAKVLPKC